MSNSITIETSRPNVVEAKIPDVSRVVSVVEPSSIITILDKYSIAGIDGASDKTFVFNQITPSDNWLITHGLNKFPSVSVVDSGGTAVIGNVDYIDENTVRVSFNGSFSGKAFMN